MVVVVVSYFVKAETDGMDGWYRDVHYSSKKVYQDDKLVLDTSKVF